MKKINVWDLWERNWNKAYKFFKTKGNIDTKSKLKDEWYKDFCKIIKEVTEK